MADTASSVPEPSIFTKIINRELPATIRYEDDEFIVIDDIQPVAPVHLLVIPKKPYRSLEAVPKEDHTFHANLLQTIRRAAQLSGIAGNYKIFMNVGPQVQAIHHLHVHVTGGWSSTATAAELDAQSLKLHNEGLEQA